MGLLFKSRLPYEARHKLAGYEHGADLYLTKSTEPEELCATLRAVAQRLRRRVTASLTDFVLDTAIAHLRMPQSEMALRPFEAALLHGLALAAEQTLESWQALEKLEKPMDEWGKSQLEVLVLTLRGKLIANGALSIPIRAVRGNGYRTCLPLQII